VYSKNKFEAAAFVPNGFQSWFVLPVRDIPDACLIEASGKDVLGQQAG
jgi:hypothetical protein